MFEIRRSGGLRAGIAAFAFLASLGFLAGCSDDPTQVTDQNPPGRIDDLTLQAYAPTSVWLRWSAPGDDGDSGTAARYDIRTAATAITLSDWALATVVPNPPTPAAPQSAESLWVGGLEFGRTYHFAIRAVDEAGNLAPLSNDVFVTPSLPDTVRPAPITDLRVTSVADSSVALAWTAAGDDSLAGTATVIDLRISAVPITDANWMSARPVLPRPVPVPGGETQSFAVTGLRPDSLYYFAIKTADEAEHWSPTSNVVSAQTMAGALPQSSGANVLANLRAAYEKRNLGAFLLLLAPDFSFEFAPDDVDDPQNPVPESWGLADESASADQLFASEAVDEILLQYQVGEVVAAEGEDPSLWKTDATEVDLQVHMRANDGSPLTLLSEGSRQTFYFRVYRDEQAADGQPVWRIVRWVDHGLGASPALVQRATWGRIKSLFR